MNGNSIFLDTNIILYLLSGDETITELLNGKNVFISFVSELEVLSYNNISPEDLKQITGFLNDVNIIDINSDIKKIIINLRKTSKIKLPDAIIAATATYLNLPLITADKELVKITKLNILLYEK